MRIVPVILALALLAPSVAARPDDIGATADGLVGAYVRGRDFSGVVLIAKGGTILARKGYGMANYELGVPNSPSTRFHIASLAKTFTAAAILMLAKQGRLSLDDPLAKFIPDFPNAAKITIRHLLAHSSGVPDFYALPDYEAYRSKYSEPDDLVRWLATKPLDFEPGARSSYSNSGYLLLAIVVQKASGLGFAQFLRERILSPLGMRDTGIWDTAAVIPNRASGYEPWTGQEVVNAPFYDTSILFGSGSLYSTVDDLYRWYRAVRDKELFDVAAVEYPFGWGVRERFGRTLIEQDGSDPGFVSTMSCYLKDDLCVIVLGNVRDGAIGKIAPGLAAIALGETPEIPQERKLVTVDPAVLGAYVGTYKVSPSMLLTVKLENSQLYLKGTGGYFLPLEPLSDTRFFFRQFYVPLVFERDAGGKVDKILWDGSFPCARQ